MEEWKVLVYNKKSYDFLNVSNKGRIKNIKTEVIYKLNITKTGYLGVCISLGSRNNKKFFKVHRAVAESFLLNEDNKPYINHKNGIKTDNRVGNLEFCTPSENAKHAFDMGLNKPKKGFDNSLSKFCLDDINFIKNNYIPYHKEYGSRALSRKFNVCHSTILRVINDQCYI